MMDEGENVKVVSIEVNTDSFDLFMASFTAFEARLKNVVTEWNTLNAAIATSAATLGKAAVPTISKSEPSELSEPVKQIASVKKQIEKEQEDARKNALRADQAAQRKHAKDTIAQAKALVKDLAKESKKIASDQSKAEKEALAQVKAIEKEKAAILKQQENDQKKAKREAVAKARADQAELGRASDMADIESMRTRRASAFIDRMSDMVNAKEKHERSKGMITRIKENPTVESTVKFFKDIKKGTKAVTSFVRSLYSFVTAVPVMIGKFALNLAKYGLGFSVGSLLGISRLVNSLVSEHREAAGSGLTIGESKALTTNYQAYLSSPEGFARQMADLRTSPSKAATLAALGIDHNAAMQMGQADFDLLAIRKLHDLYQKESKQFPKLVDSSDLWKALKITDSFDIGTIRNVGKASDQDLDERTKQFQVDRVKMNVSEDDFKKNEKLARDLNELKGAFSAGFMKVLANSAPDLVKLTDSLGKLGTEVGKLFVAISPELNKGIEKLTGWVNSLNNALDKSSTKTEVNGIFTLIKESGSLISSVLSVIKDALTLLMPTIVKYAGLTFGAAGWGFEKIDAWIKSLNLPSIDANKAVLTPDIQRRVEERKHNHTVPTTGKGKGLKTPNTSTYRPVTDVRIVINNMTGGSMNASVDSLSSIGYA